jgi:hypothetical protein
MILDIEKYTRTLEQRASRMTIDELDEELNSNLPTTPKTDENLLARAIYMRRRLELVNAARPDPKAPPPLLAGVIAFAPPGVDCVQRRDGLGYFYVETVDGHNKIKMDWATFSALAMSTGGGMWQELNHDLVQQLANFSL